MRTSFLLKASLFLFSNGVVLSGVTAPVSAQSLEPSALKVPARFGINHSSSSAGLDGITGIQGFIPVGQSPGDSLTFIDARLLLDNGGHLGGNLALGYRDFNSDKNRILGGYVGLDSRATSDSTFYQLGAGFERLGSWDVRLNGYLPLGDTSNTIQDIDIDTGLVSTSGFQGNQLVLSNQQERQRILVIEDALRGADAEVGGKLAGWKGGDLRGFVGGYVIGGEETGTFVGGKLRLNANITPNFNAGLAFQQDGEFGSNLSFSIGASLPGVRSPERTKLPEEVPIRLRESVARNPNILVATQSESESFFESSTQVLQNPEEEQDYRFIHVALSTGEGGEGTIESPFGSVAEAIALVNSDPDTFSDGNTIIYVDGEGANASTIQSFTIPERIQVLSQGPEQNIAALPFPGFPQAPVKLPFSSTNNFTDGIRVTLPFSGDGVFPVITGDDDLVTAGGDRTLLAGFQLENAGQNAFVARGVRDVELRNNRITGAGANGISLEDVGGSVILFDNAVNQSTDRGILIENRTTAQDIDVVIAGYQLEGNGVGIEVATFNEPGQAPNQIVSILPSDSTVNPSMGIVGGGSLSNSIVGSDREGLLVTQTGASTGAFGIQEVTFDQGTVTGSGGDGIRITADSTAGEQLPIQVTNSTISQNGGAGIRIQNGTDNPFDTFVAQELFVRGNTIANNGTSGIDIELNSLGSQELTIDDNTINNNQGDGIRSVVRGGLQELPTNPSINGAGISNNRIFDNGEQAIDFDISNEIFFGETNVPILDIVNNDLTNVANIAVGPDIDITVSDTEVTACVIISENVVPSGIALTTLSFDANDQATFFVNSRDVLSALNSDTPVQLLNQLTGDEAPDAFIDVSDFCIS